MKSLLFGLCAAAGVALLPVSASAFEIQGEDQDTPKSAAEFHGLGPAYGLPQFEGSSLAMPYSGGSSAFGGHVSDYGNGIAIPAPGVSQPTPAWAASPFFR